MNSFERYLSRMGKRLFNQLFPIYNAEIACSISALAIFMTWQTGGFSAIPAAIAAGFKKNLLDGAFNCALLVACAVCLLLPYVSIFRTLTMAQVKAAFLASAVVLISACGWVAQDCYAKVSIGPRIWGISTDLILALIATFELSVLLWGTFILIDVPVQCLKSVVRADPWIALKYLLLTLLVLSAHLMLALPSIPITCLVWIHVLFALEIRRAQGVVPLPVV